MFYHGTTDNIAIHGFILPPIETNILREKFRDKLRDVVFVTDSVKSAEMYAKKACAKFGGSPVVYEVKPLGDCWNKGNGDYLCYSARVIKERKIGCKQSTNIKSQTLTAI